MGNVTVKYINNLQLGIIAGEHRLIADEHKEKGGDDLGPDPYEYLLAALGSCTAMTLLMYARRKNMPLESVEVDLSFKREHKQDAAEVEEKRNFIEKITREIHVKGNLSEQEKNRLLEIAQKCPVHKTITSRPEVQDTIFLNQR
ncbi:MAG: OsmC family protein [candidate division Zixibacteria bacterium RBG-1]|nr:MAG: OsmC family protein [candidate division Zixibacteria bacterium RBG-1]OGC83202.1 MAG: hypothetical protein A2V73_06795 [candidate division Zixibacteria bacterium RBG_19FT_COMBO_42_43]